MWQLWTAGLEQPALMAASSRELSRLRASIEASAAYCTSSVPALHSAAQRTVLDERRVMLVYSMVESSDRAEQDKVALAFVAATAPEICIGVGRRRLGMLRCCSCCRRDR